LDLRTGDIQKIIFGLEQSCCDVECKACRISISGCHSELHRRATKLILDWSTLYVKDSRNDEDSNTEVTIIGPILSSRRMIDINRCQCAVRTVFVWQQLWK
jgi:hypothetical protein